MSAGDHLKYYILHKAHLCMMDDERGFSGISAIAIAADIQDKHYECKCVLRLGPSY